MRLNASPTVEVCLIFLWSVRALICWLLSCAERFLFLAGSGGRGGWQFWGSCLQASFLRSSCGCSFTCCFGAYNQELKETHAPLKVEKVFSCLSQVLFCLSSVCQTEVCVYCFQYVCCFSDFYDLFEHHFVLCCDTVYASQQNQDEITKPECEHWAQVIEEPMKFSHMPSVFLIEFPVNHTSSILF